jgi:hypothetical protein
MARTDGGVGAEAVMRRLGLCVCLLALGWATVAGSAETACRVLGTTKFDVGQTVCILTAGSNWLACTDATARSGGGAWKDTGVPCKERQPQSPADYRPVPEGPHPVAPLTSVKHLIDLYRGIIFQCQPSKYFSWSPDACARITEEFVSDAKAAGVTVVVVDATDDGAAKAKKSEAVGMRLDEAVDWSVKLGATDTGSATFEQDINGVLEVVPGIYNWRPLLIASGAYLHPATPAQALAEAKTDFPAEIKYFTDPR